MQGDITRTLYFIKSGECEVLKLEGPIGLPNDDDDENPLGPRLHVLREHACFGEQSFMTQQPALATVRSISYTTLMRIYKSDFDVVVAMFPQLRVHMLGVQREQMMEYKSAGGQGFGKRSFAKFRGLASASRGIKRMSLLVQRRGSNPSRVLPGRAVEDLTTSRVKNFHDES